MAGKQGFASMDDAKKEAAEKKGGRNSHSGATTGTNARDASITTNKRGGGAIDQQARIKGGKASHTS